jgi:hypothetical protein
MKRTDELAAIHPTIWHYKLFAVLTTFLTETLVLAGGAQSSGISGRAQSRFNKSLRIGGEK